MPDVLIATDADWIAEDVDAALSGPGTTVRRVRTGAEVAPAVEAKAPDLVVLDLQIGNMGGVATCLHLRNEEGAGRLPHVPVLILLDRHDDRFVARRSGADGWITKPLDSFRLRDATDALLAGDTWFEAHPHATSA